MSTEEPKDGPERSVRLNVGFGVANNGGMMDKQNSMTREQIDALLVSAKARDEWRQEMLEEERTALLMMFEAWQRLKELGWKEACYAPRDSRRLELIEIGSTGIHKGHCREVPPSDFPMKWFWIEDDDLWPSNPILYREPKTPNVEVTGCAALSRSPVDRLVRAR